MWWLFADIEIQKYSFICYASHARGKRKKTWQRQSI